MFNHNIGLDFGTTNSIISYLTPNGELEVFQYGGPDGQRYIPSFITYDDGFIEIGTSARNTAAYAPGVESYGNFKMRLPLPESEFANHFQPNRTPISVTADYLRELLLSVENPFSFSREQGQITGLVVSVPEIWQRDIYNLGRERLQKLVQELGLPLLYLVSEPVAAAAYYAWEMQKRSRQKQTEPFQGNLLVCDMGGGTFDISLCRVYEDNKVEVLYFDGQGDKGLESAGVAFDRRIIQRAYAKKHGQPIDENNPEFTRLLKEFEAVKIATHSRVTRKLTVFLRDKDVMADQEAYVFNGYTVTLGEVSEAFDPIAQGIHKVIQRVQNYVQQNGIEIARLFLVGGFCQFLLVQKTIMDVLGIADRNEPRIEQSFSIANSAYATSYGACLIANSLIDPVEKYIHTLGVVATRLTVHLEEKLEEVTLIKGGTILNDLKHPLFARENFVVMDSNAPLTNAVIWVDPLSQGSRIKKSLSNLVKFQNYSFGEQYRVGMRVDRSHIAYLIIEDVCKSKQEEYELGNLVT